jgi:hypothetical protein
MATLMTDAERNALANAEAVRITHLSLHTASPGITGASEVTGGSPAYARKPVSFTAAGVQGTLGETLQPATVGVAWSNEAIFDVPAGTYSHWGSWSGLAGTFRIGNVILPASQVPVSQAQIKHSIGIGAVSGA